MKTPSLTQASSGSAVSIVIAVRDRVPFLVVDAFDAGEIANELVRGLQGAVREIRLSLKQLDAAEVGVLDLRTQGPD